MQTLSFISLYGRGMGIVGEGEFLG